MSLPNFVIPELPNKSNTQKWFDLYGLAKANSVFHTVKQNHCLALVVVKDGNQIEEWENAFKLFNRDDDIPVLAFPDQETLPYDHFSPHPDIISDRLDTLFKVQHLSKGVVLISSRSLLTRTCPKEHVNKGSLALKVSQELDMQQFSAKLSNSGYTHCDTVYQHGEFAVRGSVLDLFPMGNDKPYRVELFDNEIESIRLFDPDSQRSESRIDEISILPAGEITFDDVTINQFRDKWHQHFKADPNHCPIYQDVINGIISPGIEAYLPMFYPETGCFLDYISDKAVIFTENNLEQVSHQYFEEAQRRFDMQSIDATRPILPPDELFLTNETLFKQFKDYGRVIFSGPSENETKAERGEYSFQTLSPPDIQIDEQSKLPFEKLKQFINDSKNLTITICVSSEGRREIIIEKLKQEDLIAYTIDKLNTGKQDQNTTLYVAVSGINQGTFFKNRNHLVISESELFGLSIKPKSRRQRDKQQLAEATIHSLIELKVGSPIVHIDHGVGRYLGLERMTIPIDTPVQSPINFQQPKSPETIEAEFMVLLYAGDDKLYVPVTAMHMISRYMGGDEDSAPLHKLGSENWGNAKKKALGNIHDVAAELLAVYAKRKSLSGYQHQLVENDYIAFSEQFPFEETIDQQTAIDAVMEDMKSEIPMDRLVCGDVGFGKTEVAMRAAFIAVNNSKQVMMLVPTTLLSQQHYQNFLDRFAGWPVKVDTLSRFRTGKEQKEVMESFRTGQTDILIGTHKLIQKDILAHDLGLVIIDEEHRFGVRQKEQLKKVCANVDLLTMTATPIPRTLNMSMTGLRDLSIITTPPAKRLSVKTFVREKQTSLIQEAMLRELLRGGQIFYLHNDVGTIQKCADELHSLIPEARIGIGHGQMAERELEQVMSDFYHKKYNVLVCTTIIETGIDIPNANTIIIERADKFGLAQLHQLRGRVGRSHHQAYAYLFTPNRKALTKEAEKRLTAIEESQELGAGFMLATHDLEIRGAGELLGDEQSGQIHSIGFSLYLDMLDRAVNSLKNGEEFDWEAPLDIQGDINLHLPALIPDNYLPDIHNRLILYKRIGNAKSTDELRELQVEMIDRFGLLTLPIKNLFEIMALKLKAVPLGIAKIDAGHSGGYIEFQKNTTIDPMAIVTIVQESPDIFQFKTATRLKFSYDLPESDIRIQWIDQLIEDLSTNNTNKKNNESAIATNIC